MLWGVGGHWIRLWGTHLWNQLYSVLVLLYSERNISINNFKTYQLLYFPYLQKLVLRHKLVEYVIFRDKTFHNYLF